MNPPTLLGMSGGVIHLERFVEELRRHGFAVDEQTIRDDVEFFRRTADR